jgi:hypothetical protein
MVNIGQDVMINVKLSMYYNQITTLLIPTSETCFAFAGEIIVLTGSNYDEDDEDSNNNNDDDGITDGVECR